MFGSTLKVGSLLSIFFVLWAVYFKNKDSDLLKITSISDSFLRIENKYLVGEGAAIPKVAVGYGACYDIFANAVPLLKFEEMEGQPEHFDDISTFPELVKSFAYYFRHGAAAERYMSNGSLFDEIVSIAEKDPEARWAVGGNAPVMASRFLLEGCRVLLAARSSARLREALPPGLVSAGAPLAKDDVHLILEYKADATWGPFTAPRANRYILHNDENNPMVSSLEPFGELLTSFKPNLLVVSGLQMMDSYPFPPGVREARLEKIKQQMISQTLSTLVHFEMASYVEVKLMTDLTKEIIPYSDSLGMNEQELVNLYHTLKYGNISVVADSNPRVATALDQMRNVFKMLRKNSLNIPESRKLTRIHVHTLAYQAIMTVKGSAWKRTMAAAAKASLTAHRHVCGTSRIEPERVRLVMDDSFATSASGGAADRVALDPARPVSCWEEGSSPVLLLCVAPVLVCTDARQTAGAGDNISAAGLVLQI